MRKQVCWLLGLVMLAGACADEPGTLDPASTTGRSSSTPVVTVGVTDPGGPSGLFASSLVEFDSCAAFIDHVKAEALERVGPYGLDGGGGFGPIFSVLEGSDDMDAAVVTNAGTPSLQAGVDYSTTNVQEVGVDEPDIVKTDGTRVLALAQGILYYVDVSSGTPDLVSSLDLRSWAAQEGTDLNLWNHQMFMGGDAAVMIASGHSDDGEVTQAVQIDLSDPADLRVVSALTVEGRFLSARLVSGRVSLALASRPHDRLGFVYPSSGSRSAERRAEIANRNAIEESSLEEWAPGYGLEIDGSSAGEGKLIDCSNAFAPQEFSGFDFLTVLSFDLAGEIDVGAVATVVSGGDTVYASTENLYVATQRWTAWDRFDEQEVREEAETTTTHIHKFGIAGNGAAEYLASGSIDGFLLNQFSMSEHDGYLRVASTDAPQWGWWWNSEDSVSRVDVLAEDGGEMRVVGSVGGLGEGERIFAVRFLGDVGYVVTFRQTDPLYTVDLSDPSNPQVMGELKILGYSAYLHPIGDGLLLGVGQDADEEGRVQGTQVSVFDVSDLSDPIRTHQFTVADSHSEVEFDHRAFLYWPATGMVVIPVGWWTHDEDSDEWDEFRGAVVLEIGSDGIEELATLEHEFDKAGIPEEELRYISAVPIRRSLVVGDTLFTLSDAGLQGSDLESLSETSWTKFPSELYPGIEPVF